MTRTWIKAPFALVAAAAMLLLLATLSMGSVSAQETEDPASPVLISADPIEPGKITVTGSATRTIENDQATVNLTVSAVRDRAIDAVIDVNVAMNDVIAGLMAVGIEATDLRTTGVSLHPQYDFRDSGRFLTGIRFSNSLLVTVNDVDAVVRLFAVDDAVDKATAITDRLGLVLGRAISVREIGFSTPVRVEFAGGIAIDEAFAVPSAPPIFGGDQDVTVRIEIVFEIWPTAS